MTSTKWGDCDRCHKPAECGRYAIEAGGKDYEICEPCYFDMLEAVKRWFHDSSELRRSR